MPDYFPYLRLMGSPFSVDCKFTFAPTGSIISVDCKLVTELALRYSSGIFGLLSKPTGDFIDFHSLADKRLQLPLLMLRKIDMPQPYSGSGEYISPLPAAGTSHGRPRRLLDLAPLRSCVPTAQRIQMIR